MCVWNPLEGVGAGGGTPYILYGTDVPLEFFRLDHDFIPNIYWSKVLTDQPGWYRFFRKHKIVNNLKRTTIKQMIIHLSKLPNFIFRKSNYVTFLVKKWNVPYQNTRLQFYHCWLSRVLDVQNHTFFHWFWTEKSVDFLVSEVFLHCDLSMRLFFSSKGTGPGGGGGGGVGGVSRAWTFFFFFNLVQFLLLLPVTQYL